MRQVCIILLILLGAEVYSQKNILPDGKFLKKNSLNLELGGYCQLASAHYERIVMNGTRFKTSLQAGFGFIGIPVFVNEIFSMGNHHIEAAFGVVLPARIMRFSGEDPFISGRLGYRFQKPGGRFLLSAGLMPTVVGADRELGPEIVLWVWPGVSFGWAF